MMAAVIATGKDVIIVGKAVRKFFQPDMVTSRDMVLTHFIRSGGGA